MRVLEWTVWSFFREADGASAQATVAENHSIPPFLQILGFVYHARRVFPVLGALADAGERWMRPGRSHVEWRHWSGSETRVRGFNCVFVVSCGFEQEWCSFYV